MGSTASLSRTVLAVEPGGQVSCEVSVRNTGSVVDQFTLEVLGAAAAWASVAPATLSLLPSTEGTAEVRFDVPRASDVATGEVPFAVKVSSHEDPRGTVVEEGVLEVGRFLDLALELVPRTGRGSRSAIFEVAFDNRGNDRVNADLAAADADGMLAFAFDPPTLVAEPGAATFSRVKVATRRPFLRGPSRTHSFRVSLDSQAVPLAADGVFLQEPVLPRWFWRAVLGALALLLLLILLWLTVLKPTVRSAAKDAVKEPLAEQAKAINELAEAQGKPPVVDETPAGGVEEDEPAEAAEQPGTPFDRRLAASVNTGTSNSNAKFAVEEGSAFSLTDIVLQNPAGDVGFLEVKRGGDIILRVNLSNFRDLDFHFVSPVVFSPGQEVILFVECIAPGAGPTCTPAAYLTGTTKKTG